MMRSNTLPTLTQARLGFLTPVQEAVKCEYGYIVTGAYMLFNRRPGSDSLT
jgi:hypothetical protein